MNNSKGTVQQPNSDEGPDRGLLGSGRESPLSVSELPQLDSHTVNEAETRRQGSLMAAPEGRPQEAFQVAENSMVEWPRGPRNAVSRIGYISDTAEASAEDHGKVVLTTGKADEVDTLPGPPPTTAVTRQHREGNSMFELPSTTDAGQRSEAALEQKGTGTEQSRLRSHGEASIIPQSVVTTGASDSRRASLQERERTNGTGSTANDVMNVGSYGTRARTTSPASRANMQKAMAGVFSTANERRAAALASRISSRAISRAEGSITDPKLLEKKSDVTHAAAEQLRRMRDLSTNPQHDADKTDVVESPHLYTDLVSAKMAPEREGSALVPTPPTAPPKDSSPVGPVEPTDSTVQQRSRMPQNMHETQLELTLAAEMGEQRRVAAITSRARSRIVSRAEGTAEGGQLDYHTNVAEAAAEQLRRLERASGKKTEPCASSVSPLAKPHYSMDERTNAEAQTIRGISKDKADISAHAEESCHWGDKVASEQFRERLENLAATMSRLSRDETHHFSPVPDSEDSSKSSNTSRASPVAEHDQQVSKLSLRSQSEEDASASSESLTSLNSAPRLPDASNASDSRQRELSSPSTSNRCVDESADTREQSPLTEALRNAELYQKRQMTLATELASICGPTNKEKREKKCGSESFGRETAKECTTPAPRTDPQQAKKRSRDNTLYPSLEAAKSEYTANAACSQQLTKTQPLAAAAGANEGVPFAPIQKTTAELLKANDSSITVKYTEKTEGAGAPVAEEGVVFGPMTKSEAERLEGRDASVSGKAAGKAVSVGKPAGPPAAKQAAAKSGALGGDSSATAAPAARGPAAAVAAGEAERGAVGAGAGVSEEGVVFCPMTKSEAER
ncbi:hypothetical protein, conserved, partial [Eimeria necatrix]